MKIETRLKTIQDNTGVAKLELIVSNNSAHPDRIVLKVSDKFEIEVNARELSNAVYNARNV